MPSSTVKHFAEISGKSEEEVEKAWAEAKDIASDQYDQEDSRYWGTVTKITKNKLGIKDDDDQTKK